MSASFGVAHLAYSGISGASTVCLNLACRSVPPLRQGVVFFGVPPLSGERSGRLDAAGVPHLALGKRPGADPRAYRRVADALAEMAGPEGLILVHGVQMLPVLLFLRRRVPRARRVGVLHGPLAEFGGLRRWKPWLFARLTGWRIAVSEPVRDALAALPFCRGAAERTTVIENGVDPEFWRPPGSDEREADLARGELRLLVSGTLTPRKRTALALRFLARLGGEGREGGLRISLDICGDGPGRSALEAEARRLGVADRVRFHGAVPEEALREALGRAHACLHPSRSEGLSLSVLEALACGCPVLAAGDCRLPAGLAECAAVIRLDFDAAATLPPALREGCAWSELSVRARARVLERYGLPRQAAAYGEVLARVAGAAPEAVPVVAGAHPARTTSEDAMR